MLTKECVVCGKTFETNMPRKICCSVACSEQRKNEMVREYYKTHKRKPRRTYEDFKKTCPYCGKTFNDIRGLKTYCSDKCKNNFYYERDKAAGIKHTSSKPKAKAKPKAHTELCRKYHCRFYSFETSTCDYLILTGERRGCKAEDCTHYKENLHEIKTFSSESVQRLY